THPAGWRPRTARGTGIGSDWSYGLRDESRLLRNESLREQSPAPSARSPARRGVAPAQRDPAGSAALRYIGPAMTAPAPQGRTVVAGFLGWMLDAFDFFVVVMTLTAIAREFHKTDAQIALSITLTLAFRPVGAFIFGLLADRYGRRLPLMLDLVFYSVVEVL